MIAYILIQKNGFEAHVFERGKTSSTSNTNFVNSIIIILNKYQFLKNNNDWKKKKKKCFVIWWCSHEENLSVIEDSDRGKTSSTSFKFREKIKNFSKIK